MIQRNHQTPFPPVKGVHRWHRYFLVALLFTALAMRFHAVFFGKQGLSYDESITYLCSAASQGRYFNTIQNAQDLELTAGDIQSYYATPELDFRQVATDMANYDIHPPLYFWMMHLIHHWFGFHLVNGMALNFFLGLLTTLLLFHIVRRASGSLDLALLAVVILAVSPAVALIDLEARHYQLLGLLGLCSVWLSEHIGREPHARWRYPAFIAVNTCGFLTHYYFGFLLVPGVLLQLRRHGFGRPWLVYLASLAASLLLFLAIFPEFLQFLAHFRSAESTVEQTALGKVWVLFYFGYIKYFANGSRMLEVAALVLLAAMFLCFALRKDLRARALRLLTGTGTLSFYVWTLAWFWFITAVLYLLSISPAQAVGEQYSAYIWPIFAWCIALALRAALPKRWRTWAIGALLLTMLASTWLTLQHAEYLEATLPDTWTERINNADRLVTNETARSRLPRLALQLRPDLPVHITQSLSSSPQDEAAEDICVLMDDADGMKQPIVQEFLAQPGSKHEVLQQGRYTLVCFTNQGGE